MNPHRKEEVSFSAAVVIIGIGVKGGRLLRVGVQPGLGQRGPLLKLPLPLQLGLDPIFVIFLLGDAEVTQHLLQGGVAELLPLGRVGVLIGQGGQGQGKGQRQG